MQLLLSIIIPVYNVENYVKQCIDSVLNQDITNYEIILINDGSTDNSLNIINQYKTIKNIYIYDKKNEGLSATRNYGINKANGKYIMFLDSDDFLIPNSLKQLFLEMQQNKTIYISRYVRYYENDLSNKVCDDKLFCLLNEGENKLEKYISHTRHFSPSVRYVVKKEFIDKYNLSFMVGYLHEDLFWSAKMLDLVKDEECFFTKAIWYNHRQTNNGSITKNIGFKNIKDVFTGSKVIYGDITNKNIKEQITKSLYAKLRYYYNLQKDEKIWVEKFIDNNIVLFNSNNIKYRLFYIVVKILRSKFALKIVRFFI